MSDYAELAVTTNFSFLRGASHPEEYVAQAMALGLKAIGIADRNSVAGVVRAHVFARDNDAAARNMRLLSGARLVFTDGTPDILAYPRDRLAWGRLCRMLTCGNLRAKKGACTLTFDDLARFHDGLQFIVMARCTHVDSAGQANLHSPPDSDGPHANVKTLAALAPGRVWIAAGAHYGVHMRKAMAQRVQLASELRLPLIAVNDVIMHTSERRPLADIVACIREGVTIETAGARRLAAHGEAHLKEGAEMARLFAALPQAIRETMRFIAGIDFTLDQLRYEYPDELREGFGSEQEALEHFTHEGALFRYPQGVPEKVQQALAYELNIIARLRYAAYFLTVHDIVRFARGRNILCQGRGSAANSAVCFCLGVTEVDPAFNDLLFERFISAERREPPDIDVDFEHERREEVMQYIYQRYGRHRAGLTATVISYRSRSALRDTGKAFGVEPAMLDKISATIWGRHAAGADETEALRAGVDIHAPAIAMSLQYAREIMGFPRHLSQHTGGFVITRARLDEVVPIANAAMAERTTVEWDKDDLDALGILKIDVLALGMLSCLRRCFTLLDAHHDRALTLARLPQEDTAVYDMISNADTIGVFQIESRAQMSMLPRLRPKTFYDLVIEVAIVRPGPIQGDMVHPYLRRRQGLEQVSFPSRELEAVLGKTLGVPLFQEQAMKIAIVAAGFTPAEADRLRRAMATFKRTGALHTFQEKMVNGMMARGYEREFAERCFKQIEGFGNYGFPESHAASFALLVYASAWFKCHYPAIFAAALINSQPMGFYAPAQIVRDARAHGVDVRDVDVNFSDWDCTLEGPQNFALRLGLRLVKSVRENDMRQLMARRDAGYDSVRDLWLRGGLSPATIEQLAAADAFRSIGLDRREAIWAARGLNRSGDKDDLALFRHIATRELEPDARLPPMPPGEHVVEDYRHLSLSLKAHPLHFLRAHLDRKRILRCARLADMGAPHASTQRNTAAAAGQRKTYQRVSVAGLVLVRQRPGSARGVIFMTLEDESGVANVIVWPKVFERLRPVVLGARLVAVTGWLQSESGVIHVIAEKMEDLTGLLGLLAQEGAEIDGLARADEVRRPQERGKIQERGKARADAMLLPQPETGNNPVTQARHARETARVMPKGRNFH